MKDHTNLIIIIPDLPSLGSYLAAHLRLYRARPRGNGVCERAVCSGIASAMVCQFTPPAGSFADKSGKHRSIPCYILGRDLAQLSGGGKGLTLKRTRSS